MVLNPWIISVFAAYFATLIGITLHHAHKMRDMSDFVLAGRRVSSVTTGLSAGSSMTSAWTMLVIPALAFQHGMETAWIILTIVIQMWIAWVVLAKRLRRFTVAANDALTTPEFLENRFGDHSGTLRSVTALVLILFIVIYVSSALVAGSKLLAMSFGLQFEIGVIVTLIAVASYTFIGGFLAVSRTDVFQSLFMLAGLLILTVTLLFQSQGNLAQSNVDLHGLWRPFDTENARSSAPVFFLSILGWGIGVFGSQRVIQRFIAIGSTAQTGVSRKIGVSWVTIIYVLSMAVGLLALPALLNTGTLDVVLEDPERIYLVLTNTLFHPIIIGILLVAVIAAIMSTADSQLLLASAVATDDLPVIRRFTHDLGNGGRVWLGRFLLVIIGGAAAVFSILHPGSVLELVAFAWGGMGAAFGPVTILALYWRRFNVWGALASIVSGTVIASIWGILTGGPFQIWDIHLATPGFLLTFPIAIATTLLTAKPSEEVTRLFDNVNSAKPLVTEVVEVAVTEPRFT